MRRLLVRCFFFLKKGTRSSKPVALFSQKY